MSGADYSAMKLAQLMALCAERNVPGSEDVESKAELIALLKAHDAAAAVNAAHAAATAAAASHVASTNSNSSGNGNANAGGATAGKQNESTLRFADNDMDLEELEDLDKVIDAEDRPRNSDTEAATIATLEPLNDDDLVVPPLPTKKPRDSYTVSTPSPTITAPSPAAAAAAAAVSAQVSTPPPESSPAMPQPAPARAGARPAPIPVSRSTPPGRSAGGGRALPAPTRATPAAAVAGSPTGAAAGAPAAGAAAGAAGGRKLPQRPGVPTPSAAGAAAGGSPTSSQTTPAAAAAAPQNDRLAAIAQPERSNSAPHRGTTSAGSGAAVKPAVTATASAAAAAATPSAATPAAASAPKSLPDPAARPAMNRSQPRKMSSLPPAETKAVSEAKAAAALAALTSSDGDELPAVGDSTSVSTSPETTTSAAAAAPAPTPAAATPAAAPRSTASTTEVGTKVWHSDHRYIFSINNTIPVASATEKTFTAYLVQVLDVDTGEEASILRRYRQFEHLHDKISAMYPKKMVPKFTEKKRFGLGNLSQDFIQKRCEKLQKYLNLVSELPNVFEFPPMVEFLETDLQSLGTKEATTPAPPPSGNSSGVGGRPAAARPTVGSADAARSPPLSPRVAKSPPLSPRVASPAVPRATQLVAIPKPAAGGDELVASPKRVASASLSTSDNKPSGAAAAVGGAAAAVGGVLQKVGSAIRDEQERARQKHHAERVQRAAEAERAAKQASASPAARTGLEQLAKDEKARAVATLKEAKQEGGFELHLTGFGLTLMPEQVYQDFEISLQVLGLEFNAFTVFPDLSPFRALVEVRLGGNHVHSLNMLKMMGSLRVLLLNGNKLTALGDEIGELTNLQKLDVANNHISSVSSAIGKLTALEELNMSGNLIETLPAEIGNCGSLELIDLNGCALQKLPNDFTYLTRVMELNVGNNNLTELPQDIGRMTRLCSLNVADNALKNLPMSVGLCQALDHLGAGFNIERNPIEDEKMIQRYQVGTDHLCQYLANRLQAWEQNQVALGKPKEVLSPWRGQVKGGSAAASRAGAAGGGGGGGGGAVARPPADARESVRRPDTEADKITVLCSWAGRELQTRVKVRLREMRDELTGTDDMSIAAPIAKNIRSLRQEVDKFCTLMPPISKTPAPDMSGISDKLQLLKLIISPIVADVERIIDAVQMELDVCDSSAQAVNFVKITKSVVAQLTD